MTTASVFNITMIPNTLICSESILHGKTHNGTSVMDWLLQNSDFNITEANANSSLLHENWIYFKPEPDFILEEKLHGSTAKGWEYA